MYSFILTVLIWIPSMYFINVVLGNNKTLLDAIQSSLTTGVLVAAFIAGMAWVRTKHITKFDKKHKLLALAMTVLYLALIALLNEFIFSTRWIPMVIGQIIAICFLSTMFYVFVLQKK